MSDDSDEESKEKQIGDYTLNDELGSGGFGKVVLGIHIPTGEKVAIKIMDKEQILSDELNKERVLNEISILKLVRHNNIIKLYEVMETPQKIYLVMEYCDSGEMFDYIVSKQHLTENQACVFFQEIIDALTYLHSQNIVHRDVKPENILLQTFGNSLTCKLIDFGISRTYTLDKLISTPCGTASYAPPEMHRGEEYYGLLSDVWSAGVLLYAMVFGYLPFCEEDEDVNIDNIIQGNYEIPEEASPDLADLIKHIMDIDPLTRYDLEQIKKHPWYNLVSPPKNHPGLIIGYHKIPIDERILKVCEAYGFNKDEVEKSVKENKYDNKSSIYYIILSKMKREGYDSISDLYSKDYLDYIKDKKNLIEKKEENDKDKENEDKKKGLDLLNDVLKNEKENEKKEKEEDSKNDLEQISSINIKRNSESKEEISVSSENSKNNIEKEKDNNKEDDKNKENEIDDNIYSEKSQNDNLSEVNIKLSKTNSSKSLNKEEIKEISKKNSKEIIETIEDKNNKDINPINIEKNDEEKIIEVTPSIEEIKLEENEKENIDVIQTEKEQTEIKPQIEIQTQPEIEKETVIEISKPDDEDNNKEIKEENKEENIITLTEQKEPEKQITETKIIIQIDEKEKENKVTPNYKKKESEESDKNHLMISKRSFYLNINTKKILNFDKEYDSEILNNNKLNSSFSQKLTDTLKENVFKMRNPKVKIANKEKEINIALKEIKQNKSKKTKKQKKQNISKKSKKAKISKEPLFKGNKKNDHTIIHNRNASAVITERKKNKIDNNPKSNKKIRHKNSSNSAEKTNKASTFNKSSDLNNNIKKIKIQSTKEKTTRENSAVKRKTTKTKKYDKFINKNSTSIKKAVSSNINYSEAPLLTVSNTKQNKIKSSLNTTNKKNDLKTPSKNLNKMAFEPIYKKLNTTSLTKNENNHNNNLSKAIQLSEVKETNRINKLSDIKASNQNYKKNIRITYKNIEQEDFIKNDNINRTTIGHKKIKSDINLSYEKNNHNHNINKSAEKRKVKHIKSNSIEVKNNSKINKYINSYQNNQMKEFGYKNSFKYPTILKTEKNVNKLKKYINLSTDNNAIKTEIGNEKKGNPKFWKKKQEEDIIKECYYNGPIDIKNIFFGTSTEEIHERLTGILIKNGIKYWKINSFRFYCNKNGERFSIRIHVLSDNVKSKNNQILNKSKEDIKVSEFDINKKNENDEKKINGDNDKKYIIFYLCVLSKESNNKSQAKQINKIINKKFHENFKKLN